MTTNKRTMALTCGHTPRLPLETAVDTPAPTQRSPFSPPPPWYCRGRLEVGAEQRFMFSFDFIGSVPEILPLYKVFRLLKEPLLRGCPPQLSQRFWRHAFT